MRHDDAEFTDFLRRHARSLLRTAFYLTGDRGLAEDLLQTALTKTYLRWGRIHPDATYGYVRTTLVNTATSWSRRMSWSRERPRDDVPQLITEMTEDESDDRVRILAAVRRLPPRQRAVIALRFLEDQSEAETAKLLGCSTGTVKSHTHRALNTLRTLLDDADRAALEPTAEDR